jgi:hypothetical protein
VDKAVHSVWRVEVVAIEKHEEIATRQFCTTIESGVGSSIALSNDGQLTGAAFRDFENTCQTGITRAIVNTQDLYVTIVLINDRLNGLTNKLLMVIDWDNY